MPERRFVRFLLERRYVYRTPSGCVLPYAKSANEGLFCVKDFCRNGHTGSYTAGDAQGQAALCGTAIADPGDGMTGRYLLRRLVVPP